MNEPASSPTHEWCFYLTPEAAWDAMYEDCARATKSIDFEQYIIESDALGRKFMRLFIRKAAKGVKVFLLLDKFGSSSFAGSPWVKLLRLKGGRVRFYNSISHFDLLRPWRWYPRTHVKTLLIDSDIAYTGGVCLAEYMREWRDTHIRITGPVVAQVRQVFDDMQRKISRFKCRKSTVDRSSEFYYLQNHPLLSWHVIYKELVRAIGGAKHSIYLVTPFFAPNRRFRRLLAAAARRGVDVRLLVPQRSEYALVDWICLSYADHLLRAGVRIFHYQPFMLHGKTVVIDDEWATVGSTNMDILSFFKNRESNLVTTNKDAAGELKQHFMDDLRQSEELTLDKLHWQQFWKVGIGYVARLLRAFV